MYVIWCEEYEGHAEKVQSFSEIKGFAGTLLGKFSKIMIFDWQK